jgi:hypothetical protein
LKLDDPLVAFVGSSNDNGKQNVAGLEKKKHGYRPMWSVKQKRWFVAYAIGSRILWVIPMTADST